MSPPKREDVVDWIVTSWRELSKSTIINGFVKPGFVEARAEPVDAPTQPAAAPIEGLDELLNALDLAQLTEHIEEVDNDESDGNVSDNVIEIDGSESDSDSDSSA